MNTFSRRVLSIGGILVTLPLLIILSPLLFTGALAYDLATGRTDLPTPRLGLYAIVFLIHEWVFVPFSLWLWIRGGFGRSLDLDRHRVVQGQWAGSLLRWGRRLLGIEIDWPDISTMPAGSLIVVSRHASMVDAILPAHFFPAILGRPVHYVLKRELLWLPSIDIYGHRLGNHFVTRGGNTRNELESIAALALNAQPDSGIVIFPEGTYATEMSRQRVRRSLESRGDDGLIAFAARLQELLPPKPAGTLELLRVRPNSPVVIFGHEGMEGVAEFTGLRRNLPAKRPIKVAWWVHPRNTVPVDDEAATIWLRERWLELDQWVGRQRAMRMGD